MAARRSGTADGAGGRGGGTAITRAGLSRRGSPRPSIERGGCRDGREERADLVKLAFELLAERGWERFSFRRAGAPGRAAAGPGSMPRCRIARPAAPAWSAARCAEMLAIDMAELDGMSPRERVFELIMRRLDAMVPYKEGLRTSRARPGANPCRRRLLQSRPAQPAPARRGRHRREPGHDNEAGTACDRCGLSQAFRSGSTTTRRTWRAPWPNSTAACSRRRQQPGGWPASPGSVPARPRPRQRREKQAPR